jgi:putative ABC transport system ATP-binding protein/macrolide transport system ATP-binding/permease protein/lipoprotein-releasing system ATP-binding protein
MTPTARVFIQVGTQWKEVPVKSPFGFNDEGTVIKLVEKKIVEKIVEIDVKNYTELLIPHYMHIWVNSTSFVAFESEPKDIAEKTEPFYIYLKPYYIKDSEVASKWKFPDKIPVWIPMPPH